MKKQPQGGGLLDSPEAAAFLKDKKRVQELIQSPETKALMELLNAQAGGSLKNAVNAAQKGDTTQLMGIMDRLMKDPKGAQAVKRLSQDMK
ncbi:MAG: hypothetical protein LKK00_09995 [Intestinimonas sp.]|jgi:hypothetical protein|nr:hypothetical protein [Intestinimonas sp.]